MSNFEKSVITATNYSRHISEDNVEIELPESGDLLLLVKAAKGGRG